MPLDLPGNPRRSNGNTYSTTAELARQPDRSGQPNKANQHSPSRAHGLLFDNGGLAAVAQQNNVHTNLHGPGATLPFWTVIPQVQNYDYWTSSLTKGEQTTRT